MGQKRQTTHLENLHQETEEGNADRRRLSNGGAYDHFAYPHWFW